jgi:hypothetical protein
LLLDLQAGGRGREIEKTTVPSRTLSKLCRALIPDLIAIEPYGWSMRSQGPWLYSLEPVNADALLILIRTWVQVAFSHVAASERERVLRELRVEDIVWQPQTVDLAAWKTAPNGTAEPQYPSTFHLLPDLLASRLSRQDVSLEIGTEPLRFRRAPLAPGDTGAELISWPPRVYEDRHGKRWPYSVFMTLTVQTVPFRPRPVIHCDVGVRRWAGPPTGIPGGEDTSVYVLTEVPWIPGLHLSPSFQVAPIRWVADRERDKPHLVWGSYLAPVLNRLRHPEVPLPDPEVLRGSPDAYLNGNGTLVAGIVFRNGMKPRHQVEPGLPPADRRHIAEQIGSVLKGDGIVFTSPLSLVSLSSVARAKNPFFQEDAPESGETADQVTAAGSGLSGIARRTAIRRSLGRHVAFEVRYQTKEVSEALTASLREQLGLSSSATFPYYCPDSDLTIHVSHTPLGSLGDALKIAEKGGAFRDRLHRAIEERVKEIADSVSAPASYDTVTFIELAERDAFVVGKTNADPKHALRKGFALLHRLTQFINTDNADGNLAHRSDSCVLDALRQLGVQASIPAFKSSSFPQAINYVGVWLIKEFADSSPTRNQHFLPVMVRVDGASGQIYAIAGGMDEWHPYPKVLLAIAQGRVPGVCKERDALPILRTLLRRDILAIGDSLLFCHAQNIRRAWPWVGNARMSIDHLGFTEDTPQPIKEWPGLRVIRVRDSDSHETPEWYAVDRDQNVGFPGALYQMHERVFFSTHSKPEQMKSLSRFSSRLSGWVDKHGNAHGPRADLHTWNAGLLEIVPVCLQPGENPGVWAALAHRLRNSATHHDEATILPLPLHLAQKIREYVLPLADEGDDE